MTDHQKLFQAGKLGEIEIKNRIFMAPLTRNRAHENGIPKDMAIEYYSQRASAGLIISEATQIDPFGKGYKDTPGIHNADQAAAWRKITDAVHTAGGKIFIQLWHVGRISHSSLLPNGAPPVAPSELRANTKTFTANGFEDVSTPRALETAEIKALVNKYVDAAKLSIDAGFDGVEIHGANGYLINQFISTNTNLRDDEYGGSVENRSRFLFEILDAVIQKIGAGRVGVRLSPTGKFNDIADAEVEANYSYIYNRIDKLKIAYLHIVEQFPGIKSLPQELELVSRLRKDFKGSYICNGDYDPETAEKAVADGAFAVAFGRPFISNPDLPNRIRNGYPLARPNPNTFYGGTEVGYTDYPVYSPK